LGGGLGGADPWSAGVLGICWGALGEARPRSWGLDSRRLGGQPPETVPRETTPVGEFVVFASWRIPWDLEKITKIFGVIFYEICMGIFSDNLYGKALFTYKKVSPPEQKRHLYVC
jgi:hypothetical protein